MAVCTVQRSRDLMRSQGGSAAIVARLVGGSPAWGDGRRSIVAVAIRKRWMAEPAGAAGRR